MFESIITHNDFDGIASAAICSFIYNIENIKFAGPNTIARAQIAVTKNDIVCDLPYPLECGMWFDHHEGNLQELKYRNIDTATIEGAFSLEPSCARVIYNYLKERDHKLPEHFEGLVEETDVIDSFDYDSIDEWRSETPGKIIDATLKTRLQDKRDRDHYFRSLVYMLRDEPLDIVAQKPEIREKYEQFQREEAEMLKIIENNSRFLEQDEDEEIIIIDLTGFNRRPHTIKNLAYLLYPRALSVLEVNSLYKRGVKSNDIAISMSLSINLNNNEHPKDVGEIMRELNIGDGHAGAAAGTVYCDSKNEMLKRKEQILVEILHIWKSQN
ncbi:hypothetical protein GF337_10690 [candidate division KSB1 bacterium]|nr:hypothetical protein [candidate division KSB1 bacterium]